MIRSPKVTISILNWNGLSDTLECLKSVFALDYPDFEVVVVDNHSYDSPAKSIRELYPKVKLILNPANLGFTGGNNVAMVYAMQNAADYIWLLNNDTVVAPDCLLRMVEYAEANKGVGLLSPLIYHLDDRDKKQFSGSRVNWRNLSISYPDTESTNGGFQEGEDVCLWGTALMIKRRVVEAMGYLKEDYFAYWEDTEYSLRALHNGFRNAVCRTAKLYHKSDTVQYQTGGKKPHYYYFMHRNRLLLSREYLKTTRGKIEFFRQFLADVLKSSGKCWRSGRIENVNAVLNGAWHGFKSVSGPMTSENAMPGMLQKLFLLLARAQPFLLANMIMLDWREISEELSRLKMRIRGDN